MRKFFNFGVDIATLIFLWGLLTKAVRVNNDELGRMVTFGLVVIIVNMLLRAIF